MSERNNYLLEVDAGNTRIKWRLRNQDDNGDWQTVAQNFVFAQEKVPSAFIDLGRQFESLQMGKIKHMLVCNVRGHGFRKVFTTVMEEKWHIKPEFAVVSANACGVINGYQEFERLGTDRWLAMLAAFSEVRGRCHIIDCGTTLTIDTVDQGGKHLGGYIVPGLYVMRSSLQVRSKALAVADAPWDGIEPGLDTSTAIHHGILRVIVGLLREFRSSEQDAGIKSHWFLTGGDAELLANYLDWDLRISPDLVLDGLELNKLEDSERASS